MHKELVNRYVLILFLLSILNVTYLFSISSDSSDIVLTIGDKYILSFNELRNYVLDRNYDKIYRKEKSRGYLIALKEIKEKQLRVIDFFDKHLDKNGSLIKGIKRLINNELVNEYYEKFYSENYIKESEIKEVYKTIDKKIVFQQILIRKPENVPSEILDSLRMLAGLIVKRIEAGESFSELAKLYSDDEQNRDGSKTYEVDWQKSLMGVLYGMVFKIQDRGVKTFEDSKDIYVINVIDIKKGKKEPYKAIRDKIKYFLKLKYAGKIYTDFLNEQKGYIKKNIKSWNESGLEQLVQWSNIEGFYEKTIYKDTIETALKNGRNFIVINSPNLKVDLKKFLELVEDYLIFAKSGRINKDQMKEFIIEALQVENVAKKAMKLGLQKNFFNPYTKNPIFVDTIPGLYNKEIIEKQIPEPNETTLKQFYEDYKDSLFYQLAKVHFYVVIASDTNSLFESRKKYMDGVPFEKIANRVYVKRYIREKDGRIKSDVGEEPIFADTVFKLNVKDVIGPIEFLDPEKGKQYALIKCVKKFEEKQLTYDEVKGSIKEVFINFYKNKITEAVLKDLEVKYKAKIYYDNLKRNLKAIGIEI